MTAELMEKPWFVTKQVADRLYLISEHYFFEGNRCNIWLLKGPGKDVLIDTGLGVCNLRDHLEKVGLIDNVVGERECLVICTHVHFDHSGGAHHFDNISIHEDDRSGLLHGRQTETLNYVKPGHFHRQPYSEFSATQYRVPPTECMGVRDGDMIDLGGGEHLEIIHTPGHTKGSLCVYYPANGYLFTGDFVYDCGAGGFLLDWLPNSSVRDYVRSANSMLDWLADHNVVSAYPGHFQICTRDRVGHLLHDYVEAKDNGCSRCCASLLQGSTWAFFLLGCFRCCPC